MPPFTLRPAAIPDAGEIAAIMREAMSANVRRITILGSPLLHRWVARQIGNARGDLFFVGVADGRVAGMASWRTVGGTLVLNHLHVRSEFRRHGLAAALLADGLHRQPAGSAESVEVDVFGESAVAREWYRRLGFVVDYRRTWLEATLPTPPSGSAQTWSVSGFDAAEEAQAREGFSTFQLTTARAEYAIGRLAEAVFRCVGSSILADPEALDALTALDAHRSLLCIAAPEELSPAVLARARIVEKSERLVASRARLAEALGVHAASD